MTILVYAAAALAEIAGCFSFWAWLRLGKTALWLVPGMAALALFAYLLTLVESGAAERAYAAYGGVYIVASIGWLWAVENTRPDRWDVFGAIVCVTGAAIILLGPRAACPLPRRHDRMVSGRNHYGTDCKSISKTYAGGSIYA